MELKIDGIGAFSIPYLKKVKKDQFDKDFSYLSETERQTIWEKRNEYLSIESVPKSEKDVPK